MAALFKDVFLPARIKLLGKHLLRVNGAFDYTRFVRIASEGNAQQELLQRSEQIVHALHETLPKDFTQGAVMLRNALAPQDKLHDDAGIHGWLIVPCAEYIGRHGVEHFALAMDVLKAMTSRFSSELAIRHFLIREPEKSLALLQHWALDENHHVRRLVSEGSRPRLPWAMALNHFKKDPRPVLPLLELLKDDNEEYVRRSVANHLNDISKDHPELLLDVIEPWFKNADKNRQRLLRHALRTLIKQGNQRALGLLGAAELPVKNVQLSLTRKTVQYGNALEFELSLQGPAGKDFILDYGIHFKKANGSQALKVFKWKKGKFAENGALNAQRSHAIRPITTRVYYNGAQLLDIRLNGKVIAQAEFELKGVTSD
ncbi:MAG: DNA alkylation repair protein [Oceanospirillaceae bacterium]|nr:DNA alkylation repair protein [Oceanospirillaceae bacterium]MCP5334595.1 DNA alkylation repair protein [Oceanospirillaceae bacterium]